MRPIALVAALAAALAMTSVVAAQTVLDDSFPADAGVSLEQMHKALTAEFYDPRSAQYKHMVLKDRMVEDYVICGWMNAKNSLGGYTEFYPFYYRVQDGSGRVEPDYNDEILGDMAMLVLQTNGCSKPALGIK